MRLCFHSIHKGENIALFGNYLAQYLVPLSP